LEVGSGEVVGLVGAGVVVGRVEEDEKEVDIDIGTVVGGMDVVEGGSELLDGVLGGENELEVVDVELEVVGFVEDEDVAVDFFVAE
jgi:hypothetical protein